MGGAKILVLFLWVFAVDGAEWPRAIQVVLENSRPLEASRGERLPLYILPISGALREVPLNEAQKILAQLAERGIGYTLPWSPGDRGKSLAEGLRIAKMAGETAQPVAVDATGCLDGFFNGDESTLHLDDSGKTFADLSFDANRKMGCPFALEGRVPVIKERIEYFLRGYAEAGAKIDFIFADWEIDGPIEWNDAWANSKKCTRCRSHIKEINDFRVFQKELRAIRSDLQRRCFAEPVKARNPRALVGNYAVYPHNGFRYWYDYFEKLPVGAPFQVDQKALYREWAHEFDATDYTVAMPVIYTWYPIFDWYSFANTDYRWFYNMLQEGSNAAKSAEIPLITFVHHATTAPPAKPDPAVKAFSPKMYQELLWHLLLRGHDGFFLWCMPEELAEETKLVHKVYADSLKHREILNGGEPISFETSKAPGSVISGLRLGKKVLVRRTDFGTDAKAVTIKVDGSEISVSPGEKMFTLP
jgi:hypothetical protein